MSTSQMACLIEPDKRITGIQPPNANTFHNYGHRSILETPDNSETSTGSGGRLVASFPQTIVETAVLEVIVSFVTRFETHAVEPQRRAKLNIKVFEEITLVSSIAFNDEYAPTVELAKFTEYASDLRRLFYRSNPHTYLTYLEEVAEADLKKLTAPAILKSNPFFIMRHNEQAKD
ncbi:2206_t:CDS:2, partial [Acaulospora colombiana]